MNLRDFIAGLDILEAYFDEPAGYHLGAEHGQIFVWKTDRPLTEVDAATLWQMGWFQEGVEEMSYDPEEKWVVHV